jgi:hypothetical protein
VARVRTFERVVRIASVLPDVAVGTSYGTPAIKVRDKLMARLWEDGTTLAMRTPFAVREHLLATHPDSFFLTDHYRNYEYVLVRLAVVTDDVLTPLLEEAWRQIAGKRAVAAFEAARSRR